MAKIIHASDFCLGKQFAGVGKAGDFVRKALKESLERAITQALDKSVDLFIVSGNLFATNLVSRHLTDFVFRQVERLGRIPFVVMPGTSDCLDENSIYWYLPNENRPENFLLLNCRETPYLNFPDSEITVYGMTGFGERISTTGTPLPQRQNLPGVHVVVTCSSENCEELANVSFDYVAVGGTNYQQWSDKAYSSGSPEAQDFDNTEAGQVLLVDFNYGQLTVEKIHTGQLVWKQIELDNARFRYNIEVEEELLKHASEQTLLRISFDGHFVPDGYLDLHMVENDFRTKFCALRIDDARRFGSSGARPAGGDALSSDFTSLLEEAIEKAPADLRPKYLQALVTGNAMLSGKDVIS